jgi:hypothetical protein
LEWLWEFRHKVTVTEYLLGLSTFVLIHLVGVEYGIMAGVTIYGICRYFNIIKGEEVTQRQHKLDPVTLLQDPPLDDRNDNVNEEMMKVHGDATRITFTNHHHLTERAQLLHYYRDGTHGSTATYSSWF